MSVFPTRVLLAGDGSEAAVPAVRAAAELSRRTGSELHVVHVWQSYGSSALEVEPGLAEESGREALAGQVRQVEEFGGEAAEAHLRGGRPAEEIVDLAGELGVGLLVCGSRGFGRVRRLALGSVSEGIVHQASVPVLVVRGGEGVWPPSRIVVGDDGSEEAERAAEMGAELGGIYGCELLLVRAYPRQPVLSGERGASMARSYEESVEEIGASLERRAGELEEEAGVKPRTKLEAGDPARVILDVVLEDGGGTLAAIGSRGLGAVERMRLGSVSMKVLRAAEGPVLVVPHPRT